MEKRPPRPHNSPPPSRSRSSASNRDAPRREGPHGETQREGHRKDRNFSPPPRDYAGIKNPYVKFRPLKKPPVKLHASTLWDYPSQHYGKTIQGNPNYRGATPSHVIWNVLSRYSKKGDVVVDPFCGSGTTLAVCQDLQRKGRGFDIAPAGEGVEKADARKLPLQPASVDLVFFDPPYADNLRYSDDARCIGKLPAETGEWSDAMIEVIAEAHRILRPRGVVAMFVCDILKQSKNERLFFPLGIELANLAGAKGFLLEEHIAVVRHGRTLEQGAGNRQAEQAGFMLRGFSHLLIARKTGSSTS